MSRQQNQRYIHGSRPAEQRRLTGLNRLLNLSCLRKLELKPGEAVLDVGCGLGQFTREMARAVQPGGRVVGVERDRKQLAEGRRQARADGELDLIEWRHGDALTLPVESREWGTFDVAHARFVLEHVTDPERIVEQMVHAVRPGGRVVIADDDHQVLRLWPEPAGFAGLWQVYMRAFEQLDCDPFIGRRLVSLLHDAGAKPVANDWVFFGACTGAPEFPAFVRNLIGVIETARDVITGPLGFKPKQFDDSLREVMRWSRRPDAALWYALCWAEGVRL